MLSSLAKRLNDICRALIGIVAFSPLMLAIALLVRMKMCPPGLFRRVRPGRAVNSLVL